VRTLANAKNIHSPPHLANKKCHNQFFVERDGTWWLALASGAVDDDDVLYAAPEISTGNF
jgi:hypothetical protein